MFASNSFASCIKLKYSRKSSYSQRWTRRKGNRLANGSVSRKYVSNTWLHSWNAMCEKLCARNGKFISAIHASYSGCWQLKRTVECDALRRTLLAKEPLRRGAEIFRFDIQLRHFQSVRIYAIGSKLSHIQSSGHETETRAKGETPQQSKHLSLLELCKAVIEGLARRNSAK